MANVSHMDAKYSKCKPESTVVKSTWERNSERKTSPVASPEEKHSLLQYVNKILVIQTPETHLLLRVLLGPQISFSNSKNVRNK